MIRRRVTVIYAAAMLLLFASGCSMVRPGPDLMQQAPPPIASGAQMAKVRIPFVANQGQAPEHVKFYAPTFAGTASVTVDGRLVYAAPNRSGAHPSENAVLIEELLGGTAREVTGRGERRTNVNVFRGNDPARWRTNVPTYDVVSLGEVYAGVEVTLQASGHTVEKFFHVSPGADPTKIRLKVTGGNGLAVTPQGELEVPTSRGAVRFTKPVAYQEVAGKREWVDVAYVVDGDAYRFRLGRYDRSRTLVIDPVLTATFLGGYASDTVTSLVLDGNGHVYVAGATASSDFPGVGPGSADPNLYGWDAFVAKLDAGLTTILAATFLGGSNDDHVSALALDGAGNVYVAGYTLSNDFPGLRRDSAQKSLHGATDAFIAKLDGNLSSILAFTYLGGSGVDSANAIALDGTGNVYVAGRTTSNDFPGIGLLSADHTYVSFEAFVAKLDSELTTILASTYLGGSSVDEAHAIAIDASGHVYVAGETSSFDFPGIGPLSADYTFADTEGFVVKLDASLTTIMAATFLGGDAFDSISSMVLGSGDVYVAGRTDSSNFPGITGASADSFLAGNWTQFNEGFIAKLDSNLSTILAATFLGGSGADGVNALALDSLGNVYATGATGSYDFPGVEPGSADPWPVGFEAFVAKLDPSLTTIIAATYLGGSGNDGASAIAVDPAGKIYVAGTTDPDFNTLVDSSDFPGISASSADSKIAGIGEGFVARLDGLFVPAYAIVKDLKNFLDGCRWCPPDPTRILLSEIDQITQQVIRGNAREAVSELRDFVSTTQRFIDSRQLPADVGRQLIDLAQQAIAELSA